MDVLKVFLKIFMKKEKIINFLIIFYIFYKSDINFLK